MIEPVRHNGKLTGFDIPAAHRPLTWRQLVAFLSGFAAFVFAIMAFGSGAELDPIRSLGKSGLVASLVICIAFTVWHLRLVNRVDLEPDVLAQLVPPETILQLGQCHLTFGVRTTGAIVELFGYAQNLNNETGKLFLQFGSPGSAPMVVIPPLECDVPPSAIIAFSHHFRSICTVPITYTVHIEGRFRSRGQPVRFGRRRALTKRVHPLITLIMLLGRHVHFGGGYAISFTINPNEKSDESIPVFSSWTILPIWPEHTMT